MGRSNETGHFRESSDIGYRERSSCLWPWSDPLHAGTEQYGTAIRSQLATANGGERSTSSQFVATFSPCFY